jgi:hypothetical protein
MLLTYLLPFDWVRLKRPIASSCHRSRACARGPAGANTPDGGVLCPTGGGGVGRQRSDRDFATGHGLPELARHLHGRTNRRLAQRHRGGAPGRWPHFSSALAHGPHFASEFPARRRVAGGPERHRSAHGPGAHGKRAATLGHAAGVEERGIAGHRPTIHWRRSVMYCTN